jgi:hypothetical protein
MRGLRLVNITHPLTPSLNNAGPIFFIHVITYKRGGT